jgi:methylmalonyl-CoA mutase
MEMQSFKPLSEGFPGHGEAEWRRLAQSGKAAGPDNLTSASMDGLAVGPIYAASDRPLLAMRPPGSPWTVMQRIDRGDADAIRGDIAAALHSGATGIELVYASSAASHCRGIDSNLVLTDVAPGLHATVRLDAGERTPGLALASLGSVPTIVAAYDPVATLAAQGLARPIEESAAGIAALIDAMDRATRAGIAFIADGRPWHDGGASEAQELGAVLASAVATTRVLGAHGVEPAHAFRRLGVRLAADADQFLTIAKFRAIRLLLARLGEVIGVDLPPPVHAETAWRMLSRREPTMNLVRATTAAFAAGSGGADSVTVLSSLVGEEPFNARMARNTQTILLEESSLYRAGDPGAGSGAVEALTANLAAAAWDRFTRIEAEGGLVAAVRSGSIQRSVAAIRDSRLQRIARRQIALVGVNVNVDPNAPVSPLPAAPAAIEGADPPLLRPVRLAEQFERLCARSTAGNGRRRPLLLAQIDRGEDLVGARDACAAAGFLVVSADLSGSPGSLRESFAQSGARIACVVLGADGPEAAAEAARALRTAGAKVVIAAAPSAVGVPPGVFDATLTEDTDLVSLFSDVLDRIAEPDENGQS